MRRLAPASVDDYIAGCPDHVRAILRAEIKAAAPDFVSPKAKAGL